MRARRMKLMANDRDLVPFGDQRAGEFKDQPFGTGDHLETREHERRMHYLPCLCASWILELYRVGGAVPHLSAHSKSG